MNSQLQNVISFYKNQGETPLEALDRLRIEQPEYKDARLTYAGRLDPMAEGLLLIIADEAILEKEKYLYLDKEYVVEVLFGFETDTYDLLGLVTGNNAADGLLESFENALPSFVGSFQQKYPAYSSKPVDGKSLFTHAREGTLDDIEVPSREVTIYSISLESQRSISAQELLKIIEDRINTVHGDFRQGDIIKKWHEVLKEPQESSKSFFIDTIKVSCSSGTYMRTLAHELGKKIGQSALAFSIIRTKVGEYSISP
jgi:tRNA pseudouridine55 synthase